MAGAHHGIEVRERVSAYASLLRAPNLLTAPPDVLLGAGLGTVGVAAGTALPVGRVAGLSLASMLLYGAGTTLNDYADASVDAQERPERPIPSGAVSPRTAAMLGGGLLSAGVAVSFVTAGTVAAAVAVVLAVAIVSYDFRLKDTVSGFLAMGATRGLNVVLGMTATGFGEVSVLALTVPTLLGGYVATVTWMAAQEAVGGDERRVLGVRVATGVVAAAVPVVGLWLNAVSTKIGVATALAGGFFVLTNRRLRIAHRSPTPETLGPAVGACILGLVMIDAAFVALVTLPPVAAILGLLIAATVLSRHVDVS